MKKGKNNARTVKTLKPRTKVYFLSRYKLMQAVYKLSCVANIDIIIVVPLGTKGRNRPIQRQLTFEM